MPAIPLPRVERVTEEAFASPSARACSSPFLSPPFRTQRGKTATQKLGEYAPHAYRGVHAVFASYTRGSSAPCMTLEDVLNKSSKVEGSSVHVTCQAATSPGCAESGNGPSGWLECALMHRSSRSQQFHHYALLALLPDSAAPHVSIPSRPCAAVRSLCTRLVAEPVDIPTVHNSSTKVARSASCAAVKVLRRTALGGYDHSLAELRFLRGALGQAC